MPEIKQVLVYANEYAIKVEVEDINSLDFSDLEKEDSYKKDGGLKAEVLRIIEKRIDALAAPKVRYIVKQSILHDGVTYGVGEDVTSKIEIKALEFLTQIGAVVKE